MPKIRKLSQQEIQDVEQESVESADEVAPVTQSGASLDTLYPHLAAWVHERGWIEIGADEYSTSFIRVLDIGGMVWEGKRSYPSLDAAFRATDNALARLEEAGEI